TGTSQSSKGHGIVIDLFLLFIYCFLLFHVATRSGVPSSLASLFAAATHLQVEHRPWC
ncbi:hypothetical protein CHS0354_025700, partial [Potamilus streckersoni]